MSLHHREPGSEAAKKFDNFDVFWDTLVCAKGMVPFTYSSVVDNDENEVDKNKRISTHEDFSYVENFNWTTRFV